jgi:DnaJ-class molecular chaperone
MTTLTLDLFLDAPPEVGSADAPGGGDRDARGGPARHEAPPAAEARGGRTLDELIVGVWEDLTAHHAVACPVCGGQMQPRYGSGAAPVGGRCTSCHSTLG